MANVLVVDDESGARRILEEYLHEDGHQVASAPGFTSAHNLVSGNRYDVVLTDHRMPDGSGLDVLRLVKSTLPFTPTIFVTSHACISTAVEAMREGAYDFITKPLDPDLLKLAVRRATQMQRLQCENNELQRSLTSPGGSRHELVGSSPAIAELREVIQQVAPTDATVLIEGETGSGKELVARHIHAQSFRHDKPFIPVNCAAIPEALLESQLFGHEKGAFTGANTVHQGLFEAADGGTIFLDEIGELPYNVQAKLLRILVDGEVLRLGAHRTRQVDVRIISATHRNLEALRKAGDFRDDLYYRISVLPIHVPALRERPGDIPLLAMHFLEQCRKTLNRPALNMDERALRALESYPFPGNVRELHNIIERACILNRTNTLTPGNLHLAVIPEGTAGTPGSAIALPEGDLKLRDFLDRIEFELLERALEMTDGNQAKAGRRLGLTRSDMNYRLKKYGLGGGTRLDKNIN